MTQVGSAAIGYENRGNVTSDAARGQSYQWDLDGRLSGVDTDASGTVDVTLQYDALGRRVRKGNWIYAYAGDQVVAEYSSPSQPVSTPSIRFVYGAYVDEPIVKYNSSDLPFWYHRNHQYSIVAMSNSGGSVSERYGYDPHGRMTILAGNGTTVRSVPAYSSRFTYTGRRWDEDLNVYDFRARMYDAQLGRFLSRDPLGYVDGMNVYRGYFAVQGLDPWGGNLYIIEGTSHGKSDNCLSLQLAELATGEEVLFWDGTGSASSFLNLNWIFNAATGFSDFETIDLVLEKVCDDYCEDPSITINLLGWSRGAVAVLEVAQRLNDEGCCCETSPCNCETTCLERRIPVPVNWIGMFDPVNMHIGTKNDPRIPNVKKVSIARRTAFDKGYFPPYPTPEGCRAITEFDVYNPDGSRSRHGEVGGKDNVNDALQWMIGQAIGAGLNFQSARPAYYHPASIEIGTLTCVPHELSPSAVLID